MNTFPEKRTRNANETTTVLPEQPPRPLSPTAKRRRPYARLQKEPYLRDSCAHTLNILAGGKSCSYGSRESPLVTGTPRWWQMPDGERAQWSH
jgi:hypothetical protein